MLLLTGSGSAKYRVAVLVLSAPKNSEKRSQIRKLQLAGCHLQVLILLIFTFELIWFSVSLSHRANRQLQYRGKSARGYCWCLLQKLEVKLDLPKNGNSLMEQFSGNGNIWRPPPALCQRELSHATQEKFMILKGKRSWPYLLLNILSTVVGRRWVVFASSWVNFPIMILYSSLMTTLT